MSRNAKLKRSLGLPLVALYGLGNILGAGIYVLVGKVAGFAGTSTTLAFLIAMITAAFTAFSYTELAGRYPVSASVSVYLHKAFGKRWLPLLVYSDSYRCGKCRVTDYTRSNRHQRNWRICQSRRTIYYYRGDRIII